MSKEKGVFESLLDVYIKPLSDHTHNVWAVKENTQDKTLFKVGGAVSNSDGDFQLFINSEHATDLMIIVKKD